MWSWGSEEEKVVVVGLRSGAEVSHSVAVLIIMSCAHVSGGWVEVVGVGGFWDCKRGLRNDGCGCLEGGRGR